MATSFFYGINRVYDTSSPNEPCRPCRHFEVHLSRPRPWICLLKPARRDVPMVYGCPTYEREPGSDDK